MHQTALTRRKRSLNVVSSMTFALGSHWVLLSKYGALAKLGGQGGAGEGAGGGPWISLSSQNCLISVE